MLEQSSFGRQFTGWGKRENAHKPRAMDLACGLTSKLCLTMHIVINVCILLECSIWCLGWVRKFCIFWRPGHNNVEHKGIKILRDSGARSYFFNVFMVSWEGKCCLLNSCVSAFSSKDITNINHILSCRWFTQAFEYFNFGECPVNYLWQVTTTSWKTSPKGIVYMSVWDSFWFIISIEYFVVFPLLTMDYYWFVIISSLFLQPDFLSS